MIQFRPFRNTDPPHLVEIWRQQHRFPSLASTVSVSILEDTIFSKPYFEAAGMILALDGDQPLGFIHAGYATDAEGNDLDKAAGVISQLRVVPGETAEQASDGLMKAAIDYLKVGGAENVYFGSKFPWCPFYMGLYGGSRVPGVAESDEQAAAACDKFGFKDIMEIVVFRRSLVGFRTVVDRRRMKVRRAYQIRADADPSLQSWSEACTMGKNLRMRFSLIDRRDDSVRGSVSYWDMEPLANSWGVTAMGMYNLNVDDAARREGLATFLVGESVRHLASQSFGMIEAQTTATNEPTCGLLEKLGFERFAVGRQAVLSLV